MRQLSILSLVLAALIFVSSAAKADISYDYVQLSITPWGEQDIDGFDDFDYIGFGLDARVEVAPFVFLLAEARDNTVDFNDNDIALNTFSLGGGGKFGFDVGPGQIDLLGTLTYERYEALAGSGSGGWGIGGGVRYLIVPQVELATGLRYVDYGSIDMLAATSADIDGIRFNLGGYFHATRSLSFGLEYHLADLEADVSGSPDLDEQDIRLIARWNF